MLSRHFQNLDVERYWELLFQCLFCSHLRYHLVSITDVSVGLFSHSNKCFFSSMPYA